MDQTASIIHGIAQTTCVHLINYTFNLLTVWSQLTVGEEKVEVARFHDQRLFSKRKAHLEIHDTGLHMVDLIVATWIYMYAEQKNAQAGASAAATAASSAAVAAAVS